VFLPLPLPDDQGRFLFFGRMGVYPPETKIADLMKVNMMMVDILMEENDRFIICGFVNVMDLEKNTLAHMVHMTPAIAKKMNTLVQVTLAEPPLAIKYPRDCYIFKRSSTCVESLTEMCALEI
jgi:hypothetical protein